MKKTILKTSVVAIIFCIFLSSIGYFFYGINRVEKGFTYEIVKSVGYYSLNKKTFDEISNVYASSGGRNYIIGFENNGYGMLGDELGNIFGIQEDYAPSIYHYNNLVFSENEQNYLLALYEKGGTKLYYNGVVKSQHGSFSDLTVHNNKGYYYAKGFFPYIIGELGGSQYDWQQRGNTGAFNNLLYNDFTYLGDYSSYREVGFNDSEGLDYLARREGGYFNVTLSSTGEVISEKKLDLDNKYTKEELGNLTPEDYFVSELVKKELYGERDSLNEGNDLFDGSDIILVYKPEGVQRYKIKKEDMIRETLFGERIVIKGVFTSKIYSEIKDIVQVSEKKYMAVVRDGKKDKMLIIK